MNTMTLGELKTLIENEFPSRLEYSPNLGNDWIKTWKYDFPWGASLVTIMFTLKLSNGVEYNANGVFLVDCPIVSRSGVYAAKNRLTAQTLFDSPVGYGLGSDNNLYLDMPEMFVVPEGLVFRRDGDLSGSVLDIDEVQQFVHDVMRELVGTDVAPYSDTLEFDLGWWADNLLDLRGGDLDALRSELKSDVDTLFILDHASPAKAGAAVLKSFLSVVDVDGVRSDGDRRVALCSGDVELFFGGDDFYLDVVGRFVPDFRERFEEVRQELLAEQ